MKPTPASLIQCETVAAETFRLTPSASSTSAEPDLDDSARLPCLATGTPHPATTKAVQVEILCVPLASPPVPQVSMASCGAETGAAFSRMMRAAPVISSTDSPRMRNAIRKPPIWAGVAPPDIIISKAWRASGSVSFEPFATCAMKRFS